MKKFILLVVVGLLSLGCNAQQNETKNKHTKDHKNEQVEQPKGSWKVNKTFDENGNLIRYDSIYSWSSDHRFKDLSAIQRDSLMEAFKSRFFTDFSGFENEGFDTIFSQDSLFSRRFFNDEFFKSDFGSDFMDIDHIRQQMLERQRAFLEKYKSEFIKPEDEN